MGRPAMSVSVTAKHLTESEKNIKIETEENLKGSTDKLIPPDDLSTPQKDIFRYIVDCLKESGILGNLDVFVLTECSICIDRMREIEKQINENPKMMTSNVLLNAKEKYTKNFFRCCNELCLSPQARAKMANINVQAHQNGENPLLKLLMEDD